MDTTDVTKETTETKERLSGSGGIHVLERVRIERPIEDVFDFWRDLQNLPRFMTYLERVDVNADGTSHWVVKGPAGVMLEWDATIINERRPHLLAWQSLDASDVVSAGSVKFHPVSSESTDVEVLLQYDPPAGKAGAALAALVGASPSSVVRGDLRRLKQLLESRGGRAADATETRG